MGEGMGISRDSWVREVTRANEKARERQTETAEDGTGKNAAKLKKPMPTLADLVKNIKKTNPTHRQ